MATITCEDIYNTNGSFDEKKFMQYGMYPIVYGLTRDCSKFCLSNIKSWFIPFIRNIPRTMHGIYIYGEQNPRPVKSILLDIRYRKNTDTDDFKSIIIEFEGLGLRPVFMDDIKTNDLDTFYNELLSSFDEYINIHMWGTSTYKDILDTHGQVYDFIYETLEKCNIDIFTMPALSYLLQIINAFDYAFDYLPIEREEILADYRESLDDNVSGISIKPGDTINSYLHYITSLYNIKQLFVSNYPIDMAIRVRLFDETRTYNGNLITPYIPPPYNFIYHLNLTYHNILFEALIPFET